MRTAGLGRPASEGQQVEIRGTMLDEFGRLTTAPEEARRQGQTPPRPPRTRFRMKTTTAMISSTMRMVHNMVTPFVAGR
jgi:hypothetical protein